MEKVGLPCICVLHVNIREVHDHANFIHVLKYPALLNLQHHFLFSNGIFNAITASLVLKQLMYDGYKDDGTVLPGYKFKVSEKYSRTSYY